MSFLQQPRTPVPHRRHSLVPVDLFSPPTIRVQVATPLGQDRIGTTYTEDHVDRRPRPTTAVNGWLGDIAVDALLPPHRSSPALSPTQSFRSAHTSTDGCDLPLGNNSAEWTFPLSGAAAIEARARHHRDLSERNRHLITLRTELDQLLARTSLGDGSCPVNRRSTTVKTGFWKDIKHRVASSFSLSNMALKDYTLIGSAQQVPLVSSSLPDHSAGPKASQETAPARPSFTSVRTDASRFTGSGNEYMLRSVASTEETLDKSKVQKMKRRQAAPVTASVSIRRSTHEERGPLSSLLRRPFAPSRPAISATTTSSSPKRSGSTFSLSSILRGSSRTFKDAQPAQDKTCIDKAAFRLQTPIVLQTQDRLEQSSINPGPRRQSLYGEYRKSVKVPIAMTRSVSGPLLSAGCHHCGRIVSQDSMPKSLPSDPVTDRYMASLFAAIERRLSDTIQSDSSGETATDITDRLSQPLEGSVAAPVIINFFPPPPTGPLDLAPADTRGRFDAEVSSMDRSSLYAREKRALAKLERVQRERASSAQPAGRSKCSAQA